MSSCCDAGIFFVNLVGKDGFIRDMEIHVCVQSAAKMLENLRRTNGVEAGIVAETDLLRVQLLRQLNHLL